MKPPRRRRGKLFSLAVKKVTTKPGAEARELRVATKAHEAVRRALSRAITEREAAAGLSRVAKSMEGVAARARWVRSHLEAAIADIEDGKTLTREHSKWVDDAFHSLFQHDGARPWLTFVDCIDRASLMSKTSPNVTTKMRVEAARETFRRAMYADLEAMLSDEKVGAAIEAWRAYVVDGSRKAHHWKAIKAAIPWPAPGSLSMPKQWRRFEKSRAPGKPAKP